MTKKDDNVAPQKNILDAKPTDPVPPRPWIFELQPMVGESEDSRTVTVRVLDAQEEEILGVEGLTEETYQNVAWIEHAVDCVNICHTAREQEKRETAPQAYGVNDIKRMFAGGLRR